MSDRARLPLVVVMLVAASGCGHSSPTAPATSPTAPATSPSGVGPSQLRIGGLPASLRPGATAQMTAQEVLVSGTVRECAASWSVDDAQVASISPIGLLTARSTGYATVIASCAGLTARGEARVEAPVSYTLNVVAYDSALTAPGFCGVAATMEFLDGPLAGQRVPNACSEPFLLPGRYGGTLPVKVRFTAESYEPNDFVIAESTGTPRATRVVWDFRVPMTFVPDPLTDTFVRVVSSADKEISYPFTLRTPGAVRVRNWWSLDYADNFFVELWCSGHRLQHIIEVGGASGGFTQDVQSAGQCEVKLQPHINGTTPHRIALTYPR